MSVRQPSTDAADFVLEFLDASDEMRSEFAPIHAEVMENVMVEPYGGTGMYSDTSAPLWSGQPSDAPGYSLLKDPETHQVVMTLVSRMMGSVFAEEGFIKSRRRGIEDVDKAATVNRLLEQCMMLPGHYLAHWQAIWSAATFGTGVLDCGWFYREAPRIFRRLESYGQETVSSESTLLVPIYDDVKIRFLDLVDFFPDPAADRIRDMNGAAKRILVYETDALEMVERGAWDKGAVETAAQSGGTDSLREQDESKLAGLQRPINNRPLESFHQMVGYVYIGHVPWSKPGEPMRKIVLLAGEEVQDEPWYYRLPWYDFYLEPVPGRFYGKSPAEVIRYDQSLADGLKMMLADAIARSVYVRNIYDKNAEVDLQKLKRWRPDTPVGANNVSAVSQIPYAPPVGPAFQMLAQTKQGMRENSSMLPALQGLGLGVDRASATEASATFQHAMDRPTAFAEMLERDCLPEEGKYILQLYQRYLDSDEALMERVGSLPVPARLADIQADFDISFVGSSKEHNKQSEIQSIERFVQSWAQTPFASLIPWDLLGREHARALSLYEVEAAIADPQRVRINLALQQAAGPSALSGNGNGTTPAMAPAGLLPAQVAGETA